MTDTTEFDGFKKSLTIDKAIDAGLVDAKQMREVIEYNRVLFSYIARAMDQFLGQPCCEDTSMEHNLSTFGASCFTVGYMAGRRSADLMFDGVENGEVTPPTDAEVREIMAEIEHRRSERLDVEGLILKALGIPGATMKDGVIVVPEDLDAGELQKRLAAAIPSAQVSVMRLDGKEDDPPTGMYL